MRSSVYIMEFPSVRRSHLLQKYNIIVIFLGLLLGCYLVHRLLPIDVNPYLRLVIGKDHSDLKTGALIYGTNVMFAKSVPCGRQAFQLIILITSRPENRDIRNVIRKTWLRDIQQHKPHVYHVFLVGRAPTWTIRRLREEQERHGDLVVFNFHDTYRNLTRKTLLGLDWAWQRCSQAQYIMKADDDTYINITNVLNIIALETVNRPYVIGSVKSHRAPMRVKGHKWYVSEAEYLAKLYPDYCDGGSYILPTKMAREVVRVTKQGLIRPVLHIEDVHVGRCVNYLGYGMRHRNALNIDLQLTLHQPGFICTSRVASVHRVTKEDMVDIWNNCTLTTSSRKPN